MKASLSTKWFYIFLCASLIASLAVGSQPASKAKAIAVSIWFRGFYSGSVVGIYEREVGTTSVTPDYTVDGNAQPSGKIYSKYYENMTSPETFPARFIDGTGTKCDGANISFFSGYVCDFRFEVKDVNNIPTVGAWKSNVVVVGVDNTQPFPFSSTIWFELHVFTKPSGDFTWTDCAADGGVCNFSGTKYVRFGTDSGPDGAQWSYKQFTGSASCDNPTFGDIDPAPGISKSCQYGETDFTPPTTTLLNQAPPAHTNSESATFEFSGVDDVSLPGNMTYICALDQDNWEDPCANPRSYTNLSVGPHTLWYYSRDEAGNQDPFVHQYDWTVDTTAPTTRFLSKPAAYTTSKSATFTFTGTDNVSNPANLSFQCAYDANDWQSCTSPWTISALTAGSHTVWISSVDQAGNWASNQAIYTWIVQAERAKNGAFNTYSGTSKIPTSWVKSATFAAADGKDATVKKEGVASVKITGQSGKTKTLTQTIALAGSAGDKFAFTFWSKGTAMPSGGLCQAQVKVYSGGAWKVIKTIACGNSSSFVKKTATFTSAYDYTKVMIVFTYSKASGTVWFDAVSLLK